MIAVCFLIISDGVGLTDKDMRSTGTL